MATKTVTAARALAPTKRRRATTFVLVVGSVLAIAAAFGPVWMVRSGVLLAVVAAVITTLCAWREVTADRRDHAAAMLAASKAHGEALRIERSHNSAVLQVVTDRNVRALAEITRQQTVVAQLRGEISSLKGDRTALTAELTRRKAIIDELRETVRERESELSLARTAVIEADVAAKTAQEALQQTLATAAVAGPHDADAEAEVHAMPRRVLLDGEDEPRRASDPDPWLDTSTVVDLDPNGLDRGPEPSAGWRIEPVLPNYEEDRRLA